MSDIPRGIRNNNPTNIKLGSPWIGLSPTQTDPVFCQFVDAAHGIRAAMLLIHNDMLEGRNTVSSICARWAPPSENDTTAYEIGVATRLGVKPTEVLQNDQIDVTNVTANIIFQENGQQPYDQDTLDLAWQLTGL